MRLLVGLGNPGARYADNRHNIGFMVIEEIARAARAAPWRRKFQGEIAETTLDGERVLLLKPQTYMNEFRARRLPRHSASTRSRSKTSSSSMTSSTSRPPNCG